MTPEELNRNIEFIVASQARLAAAQEQDRHDRLEFEKWSRRQTEEHAALFSRITDLIVLQSQRMDRMDKIYLDGLRQNEDFQNQALRLLNMILDRLPKPERPN